MKGLYYRIERNRDPFDPTGKWLIETIAPCAEEELSNEFDKITDLYKFLDENEITTDDLEGVKVVVREA